jgi:hypothetical protein
LSNNLALCLTLKFANRAYIVQIVQGISVLYLNICYCCKLGFSDNIFVNLVMGKNVRANQEFRRWSRSKLSAMVFNCTASLAVSFSPFTCSVRVVSLLIMKLSKGSWCVHVAIFWEFCFVCHQDILQWDNKTPKRKNVVLRNQYGSSVNCDH